MEVLGPIRTMVESRMVQYRHVACCRQVCPVVKLAFPPTEIVKFGEVV